MLGVRLHRDRPCPARHDVARSVRHPARRRHGAPAHLRPGHPGHRPARARRLALGASRRRPGHVDIPRASAPAAADWTDAVPRRHGLRRRHRGIRRLQELRALARRALRPGRVGCRQRRHPSLARPDPNARPDAGPSERHTLVVHRDLEPARRVRVGPGRRPLRHGAGRAPRWARNDRRRGALDDPLSRAAPHTPLRRVTRGDRGPRVRSTGAVGVEGTLYDASRPSVAPCRERPRDPARWSAWNGTAPRQGRHSAHPVGNCATSASTGYDAALWLRRSGQGGAMTAYRFYVGIDWATEAHRVIVLDADRRALHDRSVRHEGVALETFAHWLAQDVAARVARDVAVALEGPRGPVVATLLA